MACAYVGESETQKEREREGELIKGNVVYACVES